MQFFILWNTRMGRKPGDWMYFPRLRDLREDADKAQQEIAGYLNMHRSVYRRYESGERKIPVWAWLKLAGSCHASTGYILGRANLRHA